MSIVSRLIKCSTLLSKRGFHRMVPHMYPVTVKMPALSPTMTDGSIVSWAKKEGEEVVAGDLICEIQTDKAVVGLEVDEDGILAKILKPENTPGIKVGEIIAIIASEGEDWQTVEIPAEAAAPPPASKPDAPSPTPKASAPAAPSPAQKTHSIPDNVGPAVRLLMETYNVEASKVQATGPHGRIVKDDVLKFISANNLSAQKMTASSPPPSSQPSPPSSGAPKKSGAPVSTYTDIPLTSMRKTIAKRLSQSKSTIPHAYSTITCNIDQLMANRALLKKSGVNVSVNDYVIKACALALKAVPEANATYKEEAGSIQFNSHVDVCVAVATDAGLITPIVPSADQMGLVAINDTVKQLAGKAKSGKLQPAEFMGGTFTISNLGMFGIKEFTAIINPPQVCILAVGTTQHRFTALASAPEAHMALTLSSDARVVDQVAAAQFLSQVKANLERPSLLEAGLEQGRSGAQGHVDPFAAVAGFD